MPNAWLPKDLLDDVSNWGFSETVSGAMKGIADAGQDLMRPVTEHVGRAVDSAGAMMPPPIGQPEIEMPEIPRFDLGRVEDWLPGLRTAGARAEREVPPRGANIGPADITATPAPTATAATPPPGAHPHSPAMFSLPSVDDFLRPIRGATTETVPESPTRPSVAAAGPSGAPPAAGGDLREYARAAARLRGVDPGIFERQIQQESGFDPRAGSGAGAQGIAQFMPATARAMGLADPFEPYSALDAAARHMADNLAANGGDYALALAAYNAGQGAVNKHGGVPPFAETQAYVGKILGDARPTQAARPAEPAVPRAGGAPSAGGLDVGGITASYKGQPYVFGGSGGRSTFAPGTPTDCSGFVASVWKNQYGLDLAAHTDTSYNQLRTLGAAEVEASAARPGDVVYYLGAGTGGAIAHHMGIYAGPGKVLDMSTSGQSGVSVRDIGHGGSYVILRDPRVNGGAGAPRTAASAPPSIVQTGVAERTGGEEVPQRQLDALSVEPNATTQPWNLPFRGGETEAPYDARGYDEGPREALPGSVGAQSVASPRLHGNVLAAFRAANGRDPDPSEAGELAGLGYGFG